MNSAAIVAALKPALLRAAAKMTVTADTPNLYAVVSRKPSPFPQHKGHPMDFGSIRVGKAYVSFHLMPLYMSPKLESAVTPELKKRMQGKSCFNFTRAPEADIVAGLRHLVDMSAAEWAKNDWI